MALPVPLKLSISDVMSMALVFKRMNGFLGGMIYNHHVC